MTRRLNWFLLAMLLLIGVPYYWLMLDNRAGAARPKPITIEQLRQLAKAIPGEAPYSVEMELPAFSRVPGNLFVAGSGMKRKLVGIIAWRLPVAGAKPIMIDAGITREGARELRMEEFKPKVQATIERALDTAGMILLTHEHLDHLGPLAARGGKALNESAWLSAAQLPPSPLAARLAWTSQPLPKPRIQGNAPLAVAPGVVVIPAPSHTPGSQMIFVRLVDGREYLFTGDIATFAQSWQETRARSQLISRYLVQEDRPEVYSWLLTIKALKAADPGLIVLPGHDPEWIFETKNGAKVHHGFVLPPL